MRMRTGGFYRRFHERITLPNGQVVHKDRHIAVDSEKHSDCIIYYRYQVERKRKSFCTGTADIAEARLRVSKFLGVIAYSDKEQYLRSLVELGEQAKQELHQRRFASRRIKLADAWDEYVASKRRPDSGARTLQGYGQHWAKFKKWIERPGLDFLDQVTASGAESYVDFLQKAGLKKGTINQHVQFLRLMFSILNTGYANPWDGIRVTGETPPPRPHRRLSVEECQKIVKTATGEWQVLVLIGYYTGLRLSDAVLLKWENVDLKAELLRGVLLRKTQRTTGVKVDIPISERLAAALKATGGHLRAKGFVLPEIAGLYLRDASAVSKRLGKIFEAAKVVDTDAGTASFHSFRVTFQSLNDDAGTPRAHIRAITGHRSMRMSDTYSRMDVERARAGVERALPEI